jgi:regulatory protein
MKITSISIQAKNKNRVNVSVDGKYRFSLDVFQLVDLGVKLGKEYTEEELAALEAESQFGKLYARGVEYCLMRPHSAKEVRDYLWRKTRDKKVLKKPSERAKAKGNFESTIVEIAGVPTEVAERVFERLEEKGYINDEKFARYWVENRNLAKGASRRKLSSELAAKGVARSLVDEALTQTTRSDESELAKIIAKKRSKYPDEQKLMAYLARQGFSYDDIKVALATDESDR